MQVQRKDEMRPRIGILMGDPAGVGPELVGRLLQGMNIARRARIVVVGNRNTFEEGQRIAGSGVELQALHDIGELQSCQNAAFLELSTTNVGAVALGKVSVAGGRSALASLRFALRQAQAGNLDGILYAPLNKEAMRLAGSPHSDELGLFAHELGWTGPCGEHNVLRGLWTSRVTSHVPLSEVAHLITEARVLQKVRLLHESLRAAGIDTPRIAVSALNPHGGEGGHFGTEERTAILPAIEQAVREGIAAFGPFPADTVFIRASREHYNGIVSMYHDQGQIATKLIGFDRGVTVAGGLPIPIATPAHGTAFDIAGQGVANAGAMREAFKVVTRLATTRLKASSGISRS